VKSNVSKPGVHLVKEYEEISLVSFLRDNKKGQDHWRVRSVFSFTRHTRHTRPDCPTHIANAALIELFHYLPVIAYVGNRSGNCTMDCTIHSHCSYDVLVASLYLTTILGASSNIQSSFTIPSHWHTFLGSADVAAVFARMANALADRNRFVRL